MQAHKEFNHTTISDCGENVHNFATFISALIRTISIVPVSVGREHCVQLGFVMPHLIQQSGREMFDGPSV